MTVRSSALLPVLRSETQARLLAATLLHPERESSIADLARAIEADPGNLHADVQRLVVAGIFIDRRVGRSRLIRAGTSPLIRPLQDLLLITYGPKAVLEEALSRVRGVQTALIVGSWAARYTGQPGLLPRDVDVVVIGAPDRDEVADRAGEAAARLGREVQIIFRTPESWAQAADAFTATVQGAAMIKLDLSGDHSGDDQEPNSIASRTVEQGGRIPDVDAGRGAEASGTHVMA